MALEHIIERIKADSAAEVAALKKATDEAVHRIIADCDHECERILAEARAEGERSGNEARNRKQIQTRLEGRQDLLKGRVALIEQVFRTVREEIRADRDRYRGFLVALIARIARHGDEKVVFAAADRELFGSDLPDIVAEANHLLHEADRKAELVLTNEKGAFAGGVVLRRGRSHTVMTLDAIISDLRDRHETDVVRILAGDTL